MSDTALIECDGQPYHVATYRTQRNTLAGTVWRFITKERTLVVTPFQVPGAPAGKMHCVPGQIESAFAGLSYFNEVVLQVALLNQPSVASVDMEEEIDTATDAEMSQWRKKNPLHVLDKWEADRDKANRERRSRLQREGAKSPAEKGAITEAVYAKFKLTDPARVKAKNIEWAKRNAAREEIEARHRHERTQRGEEQARQELQRMLHSYGARFTSLDEMAPVFDFIRDSVSRTVNYQSSVVRDEYLREIVAIVMQVTGQDITERVMMDFDPEMPAHVTMWAKAIAAASGLSEKEARARVIRQARFVVQYDERCMYPVAGFSLEIHDAKDTRAVLNKLAVINETRPAASDGRRPAKSSAHASNRKNKEHPSIRSYFMNKKGEKLEDGEWRGVLFPSGKYAEILGHEDPLSRAYRDERAAAATEDVFFRYVEDQKRGCRLYRPTPNQMAAHNARTAKKVSQLVTKT